MIKFIIGFIVGLISGGIFGFMMMALFAVNKEEARKKEIKEFNDMYYNIGFDTIVNSLDEINDEE